MRMTEQSPSPGRTGQPFFRPWPLTGRSISDHSTSKEVVESSRASNISQRSPHSATPTGGNQTRAASLSSPRGVAVNNRSRNSSASREKPLISSPTEASIFESSIGGVAVKYLGLSALRVVASATSDGQPPREARSGFVWKLLPNGYWFERKKKMRGKHMQGTEGSEDNATTTPFARRASRIGQGSSGSDIPIHSPDATEGHPSTSGRTRALRHNASDSPKAGLYSRSKRFIKGLGRSNGSPREPDLSDADSGKSKTRVLLDQTSGLLQISIDKDSKAHNSPDTPSPSGESTSSRKFYSYLNRKATAMSKSSSIINLVMGKPPVNTPAEGALYATGNRNDYFKVEISDPDGPTFLPSEARRIGTPPLPSDRPRSGRLRGFFFDYSSPGGIRTPDTPRDTSPNHPSATRKDTMDSEVMLPFRFEPDARSESRFELNVPEHLPGSPLCPRSPLHPSGGKGICVYHGRTRTLPL